MRRAAKIGATEYQEQAAVVSWWASFCKTKGLDERLLVSIPNGSVLAGDAKARAIQMARLKATGLRVGYPDLMLDLPLLYPKTGDLPYPRYMVMFLGLRIEMKRKGAPKPSAEQVEYHALLRRMGYHVVAAFGADEAIGAIKSYTEEMK